MLYTDLIHTVKKLSNEQAGLLFKHLLSYVNDENPTTDDIITEIAFEPIKQQLKRDLKDWQETVKRKSEAGKKGMEKRWSKKSESTIKHEPFTIAIQGTNEQYFNSLINGDEINRIASNLGLSIEPVKMKIKEFKTSARLEYKDYKDFTFHFQNWIKKNLPKTETRRKVNAIN